MTPSAPKSRSGSASAAVPAPRAPRSRSILKDRDNNETDPNYRKAPSVASAPQKVVAVSQPPVVEKPLALNRGLTERKEIAGLEFRMYIANAAHVDLLTEVTELRRMVEDA